MHAEALVPKQSDSAISYRAVAPTAAVSIDHANMEKDTERQSAIKPVPEQEVKPQDLHEFPEGGRKPYLAVVGAFTGMFVSFGWVNCIALFQAEYETNQLKHYTSSEVSWITSTECIHLSQVYKVRTKEFPVFFMLFTSPVSGRLFDQYGPHLPIAIGTFMHVFGLMMTSLSTKYYQFLLSQSICSGIGASLIFSPAMTAVCTVIPHMRDDYYG